MITMTASNANSRSEIPSSNIYYNKDLQRRSRRMSLSDDQLPAVGKKGACQEGVHRMYSTRDKAAAGNNSSKTANDGGKENGAHLADGFIKPPQDRSRNRSIPEDLGSGDGSLPHSVSQEEYPKFKRRRSTKFKSVAVQTCPESLLDEVFSEKRGKFKDADDVTIAYETVAKWYGDASHNTELYSCCNDHSLNSVFKEANSEKTSDGGIESFTECFSPVIINISGQIYETSLETLERFPQSLLGDSEKREKYYDESRGQYFFERSRSSFDGILNFYQSGGRLRRPLSVPVEVFADEIKFFQLGIEAMLQYQDLEGYEFEDEEYSLYDHESPAVFQEKKEKLPKNKWQRKIWLLFEKPESSSAARVVAVVSISVIFLSIICFCLETVPDFQMNYNESETEIVKIRSIFNNSKEASSVGSARLPHFTKDPFWIIETVCIIWFTIELASRFICCPRKTRFWLDVLNIIDLIAIIPYFVATTSQALAYASGKSGKNNSLAFFRVVRLVRVFRIFKLSRHSIGLQTLGHTLKSSFRELGLLLFFVLIGVVIFSSAIYFAEIETLDLPDEQQTHFRSIPGAFWWAIVTMTTVGYGDMYPKTAAGKVVGSVCALCGILCLALPVPVIVSNFMYFYQRSKANKRRKAR